MTTVWVAAEHDGTGSLSAATGELLTKARALGDTVDLIALGSGASATAGAAGGLGAGRVFACDDPALDDAPRANAHVVARLVGEHTPELVLFATTYAGRDIAGRLQARTGFGVDEQRHGRPQPDASSHGDPRRHADRRRRPGWADAHRAR